MTKLVELRRWGKHECGRHNIENLPCLDGNEVEGAAYTDVQLAIEFVGGARLMAFAEEDGLHLLYKAAEVARYV